jgi:hypothetical protein
MLKVCTGSRLILLNVSNLITKEFIGSDYRHSFLKMLFSLRFKNFQAMKYMQTIEFYNEQSDLFYKQYLSQPAEKVNNGVRFD